MSDGARVSSVDFQHLENYVAGDRALVREVLALFSDQARTVLPTLDPNGPDDDWRNAAHALKGSSLGIGAFALAEVCSQAELQKSAPPEDKRKARSDVADALGRVLTDIALYTRG
jgi:HPt (histidine-containing phosphotransfer) domain-containing protein